MRTTTKKVKRTLWNGKRHVELTRKEWGIYDAGVVEGKRERDNDHAKIFDHRLLEREQAVEKRERTINDRAREAKVGALRAAAQAVDSIAHMIAEIG